MKALFQAVRWSIAVALFFVLFAFALNNQDKIQVKLLFGLSGQFPLIMVILMAFAVGMVAGILGMLPHWLRQRRKAVQPSKPPAPSSPAYLPPNSEAAMAKTSTRDAEYDYGP